MGKEAKTPRKEHHVTAIHRSDEGRSENVASVVRDGEDFAALLMFMTGVPDLAPFLATMFVPSPWNQVMRSFFLSRNSLTLCTNAISKLRSLLHRSNHRQTDVVAISGLPVSGFARIGTSCHWQPVCSWYRM